MKTYTKQNNQATPIINTERPDMGSLKPYFVQFWSHRDGNDGPIPYIIYGDGLPVIEGPPQGIYLCGFMGNMKCLRGSYNARSINTNVDICLTASYIETTYIASGPTNYQVFVGWLQRTSDSLYYPFTAVNTGMLHQIRLEGLATPDFSSKIDRIYSTEGGFTIIRVFTLPITT